MRRESLLVLGLLVAFCSLGGVVAGIASGIIVGPGMAAPTGTPLPPTPIPSATPMPFVPTSPSGSGIPPTGPSPEPVTNTGQRSLLVVGVTELDAERPILEGCWVITYRADFAEYYVTAFPPSARFSLSSLPEQLTLAEIFAEDYRLRRGFQFTHDAIRTRFPGFAIEVDIVLDRGDMAALIDQIGGLSSASQVLHGADVLARYDEIGAEDTAGRSRYESEVLGLLYNSLGQQQWTPAMLVGQLQQLPQVSNNPALQSALASFAASAPPFNGPTPVWSTFEPGMEIVSTP